MKSLISGLVAMPALSVLAIVGTQRAIADDSLPTAHDIVWRAIDTMGGEDAINAIISARYVLSEQDGDRRHITIAYSRRPDSWMLVTNEGMTKRTAAYNGEAAWTQLVTAKDAIYTVSHMGEPPAYRETTMLHRLVIDMIDFIDDMEMLGEFEDQEHTYYHLRWSAERGTKTAYFRVDDGLLAGLDISVPGSRKAQYRYGNWTDHDGLLMFRSLYLLGNHGDWRETTVDASFNTVDPTIFNTPEAVLAVLAHREQVREELQERIARLSDQEVREALARVATERLDARGTEREIPLKLEFDQLMNRMRKGPFRP